MVESIVARSWFNRGRRAAISGWTLNLSVVLLSSTLISEAFLQLSMALKAVVISSGMTLLVVGVLVTPDKERGA